MDHGSSWPTSSGTQSSHGIAEPGAVHHRHLQAGDRELALFRQLFDISPDGIVLLDLSDSVVKANPAFLTMFGYEKDEALGRPINELIVARGFLDQASEQSRRSLNREVIRTESLRCRKNGDAIHVEIFGSPLIVDDSQIGICAIYRDITARRQAEDRLQQSEAKHRSIVESLEDGYFELDLSGTLLFHNQALARVLQCDPESLQCVDWRDLMDPTTARRIFLAFYRVYQSGNPDPGVVWQLRGGDGTLRDLEISISMIRTQSGQVAGFRGLLRDITDKLRIQEEIAHQAAHDALTGLANRNRFEQELARLSMNARTTGRVHTLLYMDLDQFKVVNETCGHKAGDELLRQLADCIGHQVRRNDLLARLGGDEFGLLLTNCVPERGGVIASNIINAVNKMDFRWEDEAFSIGISIGLVEIDGNIDSSDLLKAADQACYLAKDKGRNRFHTYRQDEDEFLRHSLEMRAATDVDAAIREGRFELFFQKIESLRSSHRRRHYEILLRMRSREGKLLSPGEFIPGAERYNKMSAIDRWVVENVLLQLERMEKSGCLGADDCYSINLSGATINDPRFHAHVQHLLRSSSVDASMIAFEVTETSAITHFTNAVRFLEAMRSLGCKIMLDDFGSGLSSFSYLKKLPIDYLKIDGSLIRDIDSSGSDLAILQAIQSVARAIGVPVVAEHIDKSRVLEMLKDINVEYGQGFLLHRPEPWRENG